MSDDELSQFQRVGSSRPASMSHRLNSRNLAQSDMRSVAKRLIRYAVFHPTHLQHPWGPTQLLTRFTRFENNLFALSAIIHILPHFHNPHEKSLCQYSRPNSGKDSLRSRHFI